MNWEQKFEQLAKVVASWSKDRSTKVGCVIVGQHHEVLSIGYNGFPRGINDDVDARHERPAKYAWTEHAERNAIFNAARHGVALDGAEIHLLWFPCADCARAIIQSGITSITVDVPNWNDPRWKESFSVSMEMLAEVGMIINFRKPDSLAGLAWTALLHEVESGPLSTVLNKVGGLKTEVRGYLERARDLGGKS